ncbi:MAG: reverse transcriptase domain-containing protein, partial [Dehalococcoidia bacterium]|nr:reverse transcriptase domain-containing protein [Dehalococcoidia bacterium]
HPPSPGGLSAVGGCLQHFYEAWASAGAEWSTVMTLKWGYKIPFLQQPALSHEPIIFPTYPLRSEKYEVLRREVKDLRAKQAKELVVDPASPGFYSRLFVVPKKDNKWRPIIDLSPLNKQVCCDCFKMETPASVLKAVVRGQWMTSVDLKDAYFQIPMHPKSRKFLRFVFEGEVFQFRALCFGLSTAPLVFTSVLRPVMAMLHFRGVRVHCYLDDWLVVGNDITNSENNTKVVLDLAQQLGLRVNLTKSELVPTTRITYLGMVIDSVLFRAFPSQERIDKFCRLAEEFCRNVAPPAWEWLRLLGHLASLEKLVVGGRRRIRPLQFQLKELWVRRRDRNQRIILSGGCRLALEWWTSPSRLLEGVPLGQAVIDHTMYTDASKTGWGACLDQLQASGLWSRQEALLHINVLELEAVARGLSEFSAFLTDSTVAVMSDNATVVSYLNKQGGTRSKSLCFRTLRLLDWADNRGITLKSTFVPGRLNVKADALSRRKQVLKTEWSLCPDVFRRICRDLGRPFVDLFATNLNAKLPIYFSPTPDPQAAGVDAFLQDWTGLTAYAFPPMAVIRQTLNKLRAEGLELLLVAPCWPSREWFPDLLDMLVEAPVSLPPNPRLLRQPHFHRFHSNPGMLNLHVWKLSPDNSKQQVFRRGLQTPSQDTIGRLHQASTTQSGSFLAIGVVQGKLIRSRPLCL